MPLVDGLPDFMHFSPARELVQIIETDTGYHPADEPTLRFELPSEVYDHISNSGREAVFPRNGFSRHEYLGQGEDERLLTGGSNGLFFEDTMRMLMNHEADRERRHAVDEYAAFLKLTRKYAAQPKDFYTAYQFVNWHPVFWVYSVGSQGDIFWDYEGFVQQLNPLTVYRRKGKIVFLLEPTQKDNHLFAPESHNMLDTNLVVSGRSYEAVIIKLAARLHKHYDETGTERKNVPDTPYTARISSKLAEAEVEKTNFVARIG